MFVNIAINYRLAPQYPFPCALHDLLTACEYIENKINLTHERAIRVRLVSH